MNKSAVAFDFMGIQGDHLEEEVLESIIASLYYDIWDYFRPNRNDRIVLDQLIKVRGGVDEKNL